MADWVVNLKKLAENFKYPLSYYVPVGGEPTLREVIRYRDTEGRYGGESIEKISFWEKARIGLFPTNFAEDYKDFLKNLKKRNELGLHGYKHRRWAKGLEKIDVDREVKLMVETYEKLFDEKPVSFAAPGFRTSRKAREALRKQGIQVISDLPGKEAENIGGLVNVPVTLRNGNMPIIEYMRVKGFTEEEILEHLKEEIKDNEFCSMYIHPSYEGLEEIELLNSLFKFLEEEGREVKTFEEVAKNRV